MSSHHTHVGALNSFQCKEQTTAFLNVVLNYLCRREEKTRNYTPNIRKYEFSENSNEGKGRYLCNRRLDISGKTFKS